MNFQLCEAKQKKNDKTAALCTVCVCIYEYNRKLESLPAVAARNWLYMKYLMSTLELHLYIHTYMMTIANTELKWLFIES